MRSQALEIAWHNESSVWSVGCEPHGRRFVTAGNDKVARVWLLTENVFDAIAPVSKAQSLVLAEKRHKAAKKASRALQKPSPVVEWLCDLVGHSGTVNAAAFAPNGTFIATGADGGEVIVWRVCGDVEGKGNVDAGGSSPGPGKVGGVGLGGEVAVQRWEMFCVLRGHSADVLDLSWCGNDGKKLATASVDNSVRVWDIYDPCRPLAVIKHGSFVQGVAFDPTGRFLASLGNDRSLAIHLTAGFISKGACATTASEPKMHFFASDTLCLSTFRRLAWSPDGSFLACPSGLQIPHTPKPLAYAVHLFHRGQWSFPLLQCSGLNKLPVACAFCPTLFELQNEPVAKCDTPDAPKFALPYRMMFAVACHDSVLIYDTESFERPLSRIGGVHYAELTGISWTPDGLSILVSSSDGSVSVIAMSEGELGTPLAESKIPVRMRTPTAACSTDDVNQKSVDSSANADTAVEPMTPITVMPRRKAGCLEPPLPEVAPIPGILHERDGVREVVVIVPPKKDPNGPREICGAVGEDDPARKRLKLEDAMDDTEK